MKTLIPVANKNVSLRSKEIQGYYIEEAEPTVLKVITKTMV